MKRFILIHKGENIYKDKRSFKSKYNADKKVQDFRTYETICNSRIGVEVQEIEVETAEEILQAEIQSLRGMIVEARPYLIQYSNDFSATELMSTGELRLIRDLIIQTKDIKVD